MDSCPFLAQVYESPIPELNPVWLGICIRLRWNDQRTEVDVIAHRTKQFCNLRYEKRKAPGQHLMQQSEVPAFFWVPCQVQVSSIVTHFKSRVHQDWKTRDDVVVERQGAKRSWQAHC
mmetsp:Transcript_19903/g.39439  ORF Transcript_19903/g.39439 Transcript_19903/m.39439 type:complete len:118 (+) Transcript_19903:248-601(+)